MAFRILSFCGGGVRGLMSAMILNRLNHTFHDRHGVWLPSVADCFAGTSTGSFIAGLLLSDFSTEAIVDLYNDVVVPAVAKAKTDPTQPALASMEWITILDRLHLGPFRLDPMLATKLKKCIFTSFDLGAENLPWSPLLLNNFPGSQTAGFRVFDAMAASGAMPGISPPFQVTAGGRQYNLVDGAFVHHDPTVPAIALAVGSGVLLDTISVIDIGTGFMRNFVTADVSGWGSTQWTHGSGAKDGQLPPLLVNTPDTPAHEMPILNMTLSGTSTHLMPDLARLMLHDRFAYLNPDFEDRVVSELASDPADIEFLRAQATNFDLTSALAVLETYWLD